MRDFTAARVEGLDARKERKCSGGLNPAADITKPAYESTHVRT